MNVFRHCQCTRWLEHRCSRSKVRLRSLPRKDRCQIAFRNLIGLQFLDEQFHRSIELVLREVHVQQLTNQKQQPPVRLIVFLQKDRHDLQLPLEGVVRLGPAIVAPSVLLAHADDDGVRSLDGLRHGVHDIAVHLVEVDPDAIACLDELFVQLLADDFVLVRIADHDVEHDLLVDLLHGTVFMARLEIPADTEDDLAHFLIVTFLSRQCQLVHERSIGTELPLNILVERETPQNAVGNGVLIGHFDQERDLVRIGCLLLNGVVLGQSEKSCRREKASMSDDNEKHIPFTDE